MEGGVLVLVLGTGESTLISPSKYLLPNDCLLLRGGGGAGQVTHHLSEWSSWVERMEWEVGRTKYLIFQN